MSERGKPELSRHVRDLWPENTELFTVGELVERQRSSPGWEAVQSVLDREVRALDSELDSGRELSQAEYAYKHGRRGALRASVEAATAIIAKAAERQARDEKDQQTAEPVGRQ